MGQYVIGSQPINDICMMLLYCIPFSLMRAFHGIMQMFHIFGQVSIALPLYNVTLILLHWCGLKLCVNYVVSFQADVTVMVQAVLTFHVARTVL